METSFDLVEEGWIPCMAADGQHLELGLSEVLANSHELRELHGESPLVTASLYRLLLAVLHRVFGPASPEEWDSLWRAGRWNASLVDAYLDGWRHRFDLFHPEHPFYQVTDAPVKVKSVLSLIQDAASGYNATLFDHHTEAEGIILTPPQAARMLVAAQTFALGGGKSGLPKNFTDAPCAKGVIFLVHGKDLFETLALNLLRYPTPDSVMQHHSDDRPAWEMDDPFDPDRTRPRGYLDYLTWHSRQIKLFPEATSHGFVVREMKMTQGLVLAHDIHDTMKHYHQDPRRGFLVLRFREERALWRDSAALFALHSPAERPPPVFYWLAKLVDEGYLDKSRTRRYLALGMANRQARVDFYRSEHMPLPLEYLEDEQLVERLRTALDMAGQAARQLRDATRTLAKFVLSPLCDAENQREPTPEVKQLSQQWAVERRYWASLELPFRETMVDLPKVGEEALVAWGKVLRRTAWEAFEGVADGLGHDPYSLKAVVLSRGQLAAGLARVLGAQ